MAATSLPTKADSILNQEVLPTHAQSIAPSGVAGTSSCKAVVDEFLQLIDRLIGHTPEDLTEPPFSTKCGIEEPSRIVRSESDRLREEKDLEEDQTVDSNTTTVLPIAAIPLPAETRVQTGTISLFHFARTQESGSDQDEQPVPLTSTTGGLCVDGLVESDNDESAAQSITRSEPVPEPDRAFQFVAPAAVSPVAPHETVKQWKDGITQDSARANFSKTSIGSIEPSICVARSAPVLSDLPIAVRLELSPSNGIAARSSLQSIPTSATRDAPAPVGAGRSGFTARPDLNLTTQTASNTVANNFTVSVVAASAGGIDQRRGKSSIHAMPGTPRMTNSQQLSSAVGIFGAEPPPQAQQPPRLEESASHRDSNPAVVELEHSEGLPDQEHLSGGVHEASRVRTPMGDETTGSLGAPQTSLRTPDVQRSEHRSSDVALLQPEPQAQAKPRPATQLKEIALSVGAGTGDDVQVRVRQRLGAVQVSIHTSDSDVRTAIRQDLGDLMASLERRGFSPEPVSYPRDGGSPGDANSPRGERTEGPTRLLEAQSSFARGDDPEGHQRQQNPRTPWEVLMQSRPRRLANDEWTDIMEAAQWQVR
jgi:hypothetical protein